MEPASFEWSGDRTIARSTAAYRSSLNRFGARTTSTVVLSFEISTRKFLPVVVRSAFPSRGRIKCSRLNDISLAHILLFVPLTRVKGPFLAGFLCDCHASRDCERRLAPSF